MPRAAYDQVADVYEGAGVLTPGAFRFSVACRLVDDQHRITQRPVELRSDFYANYTGLQSSAGPSSVVGGLITVDSSLADIWEIPAGSGTLYQVLRTEVITPRRPSLPPYRRVHFLA